MCIRDRCNTGCASDVLDIKAEDGEVIYTCPLYGGTVLEDVKIKTTPQIATLRSGAFQKVEDPTEGEVVALSLIHICTVTGRTNLTMSRIR